MTVHQILLHHLQVTLALAALARHRLRVALTQVHRATQALAIILVLRRGLIPLSLRDVALVEGDTEEAHLTQNRQTATILRTNLHTNAPVVTKIARSLTDRAEAKKNQEGVQDLQKVIIVSTESKNLHQGRGENTVTGRKQEIIQDPLKTAIMTTSDIPNPREREARRREGIEEGVQTPKKVAITMTTSEKSAASGNPAMTQEIPKTIFALSQERRPTPNRLKALKRKLKIPRVVDRRKVFVEIHVPTIAIQDKKTKTKKIQVL